MRHIWQLMKTNLKKNYIAIVLAVLSGAILCFIFYAIGNLSADQTLSKIKVGVLDEDESFLSEDFKHYLENQLNYEILEKNSYEELSTELIEKDISVIIEIPKNFQQQWLQEENGKLIITSLDDYENAAFVQIYIDSYLNSIRILGKSAQNDSDFFRMLLMEHRKHEIPILTKSALTIDEKELAHQEGFIYSAGFFLMFVFAISVIFAYMIVDDRISGVLNRIQATPVKPIHYIFGTGIFGLLITLIMLGIYLGYLYFMKINTGVPYGTILLLMSLYALFTVSFTMTSALAFKLKNTVTSVMIGFSTIGCILGGAYFPIEMSPKSLQSLARIMPQFWYMDAFRKIQENSSAAIGSHIVILVLYTILALLIGAVLFSQHFQKN